MPNGAASALNQVLEQNSKRWCPAVSRVDNDFWRWAPLPRLLYPIDWFAKEVELRETVQLYSNLPPEETMEKRLVVPLARLAISLACQPLLNRRTQAVHKIVQQRDLLGVPDALAKFDELLHKLEEA